jgi:hypothetical protein
MNTLNSRISTLAFSLTLAGLPLYAADVNDLTYEVRGDAVTIISCDRTASGELVIPAEIEEKPVTSMFFEAFIHCASLTRVVVPPGVKSISKGTFAFCSNLRSVIIPESVTSIREGAFAYCSSLVSADLPDNLRNLERDAFLNCTKLPSVRIPDRVRYISTGVFAHCHSLTSVILPERLPVIGNNAFYECLALSEINIPINVGSIGREAFMHCENLTSVRIPDSVYSMSNGCFAFCKNLENLMFEGDAPELGSGAFFGLPAGARVTYAAGAAGFQANTFGGIAATAGEIPELNPSMTKVMVTVNPDRNGSETTWEVTDAGGQVYGSGGPYNDFSFNPEVFRFYVPYNAPLRITVRDAGGDGMVNNGLHLGTWNLTHDDTVLASGGGNFGSEQSAVVAIQGSSILPVIISVAGEGTPNALTSFAITFASNEGWTYAIDRSRDLDAWQPLSANIRGEEETTEFTDDSPILDGNGVFYRVRALNR